MAAEAVTVRAACPQDAAAYRALYLQLDKETPFRLYKPGERPEDLAGFAEEIHRFSTAPQSTLLVAQRQATEELVGYLQAMGRASARVRHVVSINVAILQTYTGRGIGGQLFAALEAWALRQGVYRLDLSVMTTNLPAQKLYRRLGYVQEGIKRRSMLVDGVYVDELYMSKWIGPESS